MFIKKLISIILLITFFVSCKSQRNEKVIIGDIYIKLLDVGSLYGASEEVINDIKSILRADTLNSKANSNSIYEYYKILNKNNLLDKPYFKLKINNNSIINVYTNETEFSKVEILKDSLNRDKERIEVELVAKKINDSIYYSNNILSVKKLMGKTDWSK